MANTSKKANTNKKSSANRPCKTWKQKVAGVKSGAAKGTKKLGSLAVRSGKEIAVDLASAGVGVVVGGLAATSTHNMVTVGSQSICNAYNMHTGKGTVSVKGKFGGWKELSTAEYTAAINKGKTFKEAIPNYFTNRHADEINAVADGVCTVAVVTGTIGSFAVSRTLLKNALTLPSTRAKIIEEYERNLNETFDDDDYDEDAE